MSTPSETQSRRERTWIYWTACGVLVLAAILAFMFFREVRETTRAQEKADQLVAAMQDAGASTPDRDRIVNVLGDDGGATCESPNEALSRAAALAVLANGATGPGIRPVIADSRAVRGQLLIMEIYCPEELDEFREFVNDLQTDDLVRQ